MKVNMSAVDSTESTSDSGETPLTSAVLEGDLEQTMFLLGQGADIEEVSDEGYTPLMIAVGEGHEELVFFLLSHGAEINTVTEETKETALTIASGSGSMELADFLIKEGADLELGFCTALMRASQEGEFEMVRYLLTVGAKLTTTNATGDTALTYACKKGHTKIFEMLLTLYEKLDILPLVNFDFLLSLAVCGDHYDLVGILLERGANFEKVNAQGFTPLMEASRRGHVDIVLYLLSEGASMNTVSEEHQETALTLASGNNFEEVVDLLLKSGADFELGGKTPLMKAAEVGNFFIVRMLIQEGANVNAATKTGETALTLASNNGHRDIAEHITSHLRLQNNCNQDDPELFALVQLIRNARLASMIDEEIWSDDDLDAIGAELENRNFDLDTTSDDDDDEYTTTSSDDDDDGGEKYEYGNYFESFLKEMGK